MTDSSQPLARLRGRYERSLPAKQSALRAAWRTFREAPDPATVRELQVLVHRLAGSAPGYGYPELGEFAAAADALLMRAERAAVSHERSIELANALEVPMQALLDALSSTIAAAS